jgi:3D (Asp-Asp-Asp) domain-containing protein
MILPYTNSNFVKKNEASPSIRKDFANLDESIGHNRQEKDTVAIKDEPIRPGKTLNEQKEENKVVIKPKKKLTVILTGYYTPEPNQSKYLTGNFAREKRLNGSGKITASGKVPEKGKTVAAHPKFLSSGTKIRIKDVEGLEGVFEVEDGGELVIGNRIDVYMGKGEIALKKAINLGKKKATIEVL